MAESVRVLVGTVSAVVDAVAREVCAHAELPLLTPELLAPMLWNRSAYWKVAYVFIRYKAKNTDNRIS